MVMKMILEVNKQNPIEMNLRLTLGFAALVEIFSLHLSRIVKCMTFAMDIHMHQNLF